jgi:hypothetical protein
MKLEMITLEICRGYIDGIFPHIVEVIGRYGGHAQDLKGIFG